MSPSAYSIIDYQLYDVCRNYGARGDGVVDDTAAIQAALTACPQWGCVYFPPLNYKISAPLTLATNNVTIRGIGVAFLNFVGCAGDWITITGDNVTLENLYITGDGLNNGYGVYGNLAIGLTLVNVTVNGCQKNCVYVNNCYYVNTRNCLFQNTAAPTYSAFYHGNQANDVTHLHSAFSGYNGAIGCEVYHSSAVNFIGCSFEGGAGGPSVGLDIIDGSAINVQGCYFEGENVAQIRIGHGAAYPYHAYAVNLLGNYHFINQTNCVGILIEQAWICTISGNIMNNSGGVLGTKGISISATAPHITDVRIESDNLISLNIVTPVDDPGKRTINHFGHRTKYATAVPVDGNAWELGDTVLNSAAVKGQNVGWVCTVAGAAVKENWTTGNAYTAGDFVWNANRLYVAATTGTAGITPPTHATGTVSDGGVDWTWCSTAWSTAAFEPFGEIGKAGSGSAVTGKSTAAESGMDVYHRTTLTLSLTGANDLDLADGSDNGTGVKVYDFPAGIINILGVTIDATVVCNAAFNANPNDEFYMAAGIVPGAVGDGDLTGTEADLLPKITFHTGSAPEMLLNSDLESLGSGGSDTWAHWWFTANTGSFEDENVNVHGGNHAAKMTSGAGLDTSGFQNRAVTPGATYDFSVWACGDGVNDGRYGIYDYTHLNFIIPLTHTGVTALAYSQVTTSFVAPAGCTMVRVLFYSSSVNGGICYWDDVSLKPQVGANFNLTNAWKSTRGASAEFDGATGSPVDLFLNAAVKNADTIAPVTIEITGTMQITWVQLGDF